MCLQHQVVRIIYVQRKAIMERMLLVKAVLKDMVPRETMCATLASTHQHQVARDSIQNGVVDVLTEEIIQ